MTPLEVRCRVCDAQPGEPCTIFSELLGRVRELREPHAARKAYARHATRRKEKGSR